MPSNAQTLPYKEGVSDVQQGKIRKEELNEKFVSGLETFPSTF